MATSHPTRMSLGSRGWKAYRLLRFVPPGFVAFGWTRQEPSQKQGDQEKFGYGTISLVEYHATDATGKVWEDGNSMTAISPLQALRGDHIPSVLDQRTDSRSRATSAAMRLLAPHDLQARAAQALTCAKIRTKSVTMSESTQLLSRSRRITIRSSRGHSAPNGYDLTRLPGRFWQSFSDLGCDDSAKDVLHTQ